MRFYTRLFTVLYIAICLVVFSSGAVSAGSVSQGPKNITAGAYKIGDERVKFKAQIVFTADRNALDKIVADSQYQSGTHIWDDQWYYVTLPDNHAKYWLLSWYNLDQREYGWLLIQNTPSKWLYETNNTTWSSVGGNGKQLKRTWWSNGERIDIDLYNPENSGGWTANDIWYSFGY